MSYNKHMHFYFVDIYKQPLKVALEHNMFIDSPVQLLCPW